MSKILNEFTTSHLLLRESATQNVEQLIFNLHKVSEHKHANIKEYSIPVYHESMICSSDIESSGNPFDAYETDSVVLVPIVGIMTKYSYIDWDEFKFVPGMDIIAELIRKACQSSKIAAIAVLANTPGGTTQSIYQLEDALRHRTKPCIGIVDGMCMSAGIYTLSFCDKIFATNRMCEVGSIGTFAKIADDSGFYEKIGIKIVSVYPPESKYKNLAVREALDGKPKRMIDEQLTPFAVHFQNIVKKNRPKLDESAEGILEGAEFYAYDALKFGLIDDIKSIDEAISEAANLASEQKQLYSQLNN